MHKDIVGQELKIDDYIVAALTGRDPEISIYQITNLNGRYPGQLECIRINVPKNRQKVNNRKFTQVMKIDPAVVTFMKLSNK